MKDWIAGVIVIQIGQACWVQNCVGKGQIKTEFTNVEGNQCKMPSCLKTSANKNLKKELKFSFSEKTTKICAICLMVWRLPNKCQNHKADCANSCGLLRKAGLYQNLFDCTFPKLYVYKQSCFETSNFLFPPSKIT